MQSLQREKTRLVAGRWIKRQLLGGNENVYILDSWLHSYQNSKYVLNIGVLYVNYSLNKLVLKLKVMVLTLEVASYELPTKSRARGFCFCIGTKHQGAL